jgi:hypothetical protein
MRGCHKSAFFQRRVFHIFSDVSFCIKRYKEGAKHPSSICVRLVNERSERPFSSLIEEVIHFIYAFYRLFIETWEIIADFLTRITEI